MKCLQKPLLITIVINLFVLFFSLDARAQVLFPGPTVDVEDYTSSVTTGDFNGDNKLDLAAANSTGNTVSILLGNGDGTFGEKLVCTTGIEPFSVTTGDFNGDNEVDIAVANKGSNTVSVLIAIGNGTFISKVDYATGNDPISVTTGYLNEDNNLDLAVANNSDNTVSILIGNGDGTFMSLGSAYQTGSNPSSISAGDFDGDNIVDLAVANKETYSYQGSVSILVGRGDGTFMDKVDYETGGNPNSITTGDFNGDNIADLAVANSGEYSVSVFISIGSGIFTSRVNYGTGSAPYSVTTGDFNGDNQLDLAVANRASNTVSILIGYGNGTFERKVDYEAGSDPILVTTGDFSEDNKIDLAVVDSYHTISILIGNGDGTFISKVDYRTDHFPYSVMTGDFNKDNKLDLVVANWASNTLSVLIAIGNGTFISKVDYATGNDPISVTTGYLNEDNNLDLAVANNSDNTVSILIGRGDGTFMDKVDYTTGNDPISVTSGYLNEDNKLDLAVVNEHSNTVSILIGNGDGTFMNKVDYGTGAWPYSITSGDFNRDNKVDLAVANKGQHTVSILIGNGDGTFMNRVEYGTGGSPHSITAGDFDGDNIADLAVANQVSHTVSILFGSGDGTIKNRVDCNTGMDPCSVTTGDFNGDNKSDLAVANWGSNTISVLINKGDGTFMDKIDYSTWKTPYSVAGGDLNGDNLADLAVANFENYTVSILLNYGEPIFKFFIVNTADDNDDGECNNEHCSLREAINAANANFDTLAACIKFNIPGTEPYTIQPLSPLPELTNPVIIDGTTQPGYYSAPVIEIEGSNISAPENGLTVSGGNSIIKGLTINNFRLSGIFLNNYGGNIVQSNYLGTDVTGTIAKHNREAGVTVYGVPNNLIGGSSLGLGNLISGNDWNGISITDPDSKNNIVQGNYIGTTADGLSALPNGDFGIRIHDATDNIIGGTSPGERNVISGNGYPGYVDKGHGVLIEYCDPNANNSVIGNYIGVDKTGMTALPNTWAGISILNAPDNIIGPGNVISGNEDAGIYIWNYLPNGQTSSNNIVKGNLIGTNFKGTTIIPNAIGIFIGYSWNNRIGSAAVSDRNIISGNLYHGIEVKYPISEGNRIFNNYIGTDITGTTALGNGSSHSLNIGSGVFINKAPSTLIGREEPAVGNLISGNVGNGIYLIGSETINTGVYNNKIGCDYTGQNPLPNSINGLLFDCINDTGNNVGAANNNMIKHNRIAFNNENGIAISVGEQNLISENRIFSNGLLGIDLGNDGVTDNDIGDVDTGPNLYQNYPFFNEATALENVIVEGSLYSFASTEYTIEFFKNAVRDDSFFGEGRIFLGNTIVNTNNIGVGDFEVEFGNAQAGDIITATATDPGNNTSEFSRGKTVKLPVLSATLIINQGTSSTTFAYVPGGSVLASAFGSATFESSWEGSDIVMTLTTPSGIVITRTTIPLPEGVTYEQTPTSEKYIIEEPEAGKWDIELYGADVPQGGETATLVVEGDPKEPLNTVTIDVQPGEEIGTINCTDMQGVIPVAILTTADFDATQINHTTVYFGTYGSEAQEIHHRPNGKLMRHEEDVDEDGDTDLVFHFLFEETGIQCGDEYATLTGFTFDGKMVRGTDEIKTTGLNKNALSEGDLIPKTYNLQQSFPNPFNPTTVIRYELPEQCFVKIEVYNLIGELMSVLKNELMQPGYHEVLFNGNNISSGVYFYRIKAGSFIETKKMVLMK